MGNQIANYCHYLKFCFCGLALALCSLFAIGARAEIIWHWQDEFTEEERDKLQQWIRQTTHALETHVAPYPFDVHLYFYRADEEDEPVPWANTRRAPVQGIDFHVAPEFSLQAFLDDWTAPHELSHLLIPFVGKRNAWFAEGFASYMQYQVMRAQGVLSTAQIQERYRIRIEKAAQDYRLNKLPFAQAAPTLRKNAEYPTMYWGGAVYFLQVDSALRHRGSSLRQVLAEYVRCCRNNSEGLKDLVANLDRISASSIFSDGIRKNRERQGFPPYRHLFINSAADS